MDIDESSETWYNILYERKDSMVTLNPKELSEAGDITLL